MSLAHSSARAAVASNVTMSVFDAFMPRERQISRFATSLRNSLEDNI
jgi:hypothetical protein